jgi:hypothetical protein
VKVKELLGLRSEKTLFLNVKKKPGKMMNIEKESLILNLNIEKKIGRTLSIEKNMQAS